MAAEASGGFRTFELLRFGAEGLRIDRTEEAGMRTRREMLLGSLAGFTAAIAAARPETAPLQVTYYFLPG